MQGVLGYDPLKAALLLIPLPIVSSVVAPLSGVISDRIGARIPASIGLLIQGAALCWFTRLVPATPYWQVAVGLAFMGLGGGMFFPPNTRAAMNASPSQRLGIASATLALLRQTGMVTSFALSLAVAAGSLPRDVVMEIFVGNNVQLGSQPMRAFVTGMHNAFFVSIGLSLLAAAMSMIRGKEVTRKGIGSQHSQ
jgi:MFS family permease